MRQIPLACLNHTKLHEHEIAFSLPGAILGGAKLSGPYFLVVPCTATPKASKAHRFGVLKTPVNIHYQILPYIYVHAITEVGRGEKTENDFLQAKAQTWPYFLHRQQVHIEYLSQCVDLSFEQDLEISPDWGEVPEEEGEGYMLG